MGKTNSSLLYPSSDELCSFPLLVLNPVEDQARVKPWKSLPPLADLQAEISHFLHSSEHSCSQYTSFPEVADFNDVWPELRESFVAFGHKHILLAGLVWHARG